MGIKVREVEAIDAWVESDERLWLTQDDQVVSEGDPAAAFLFAIPGQRISREDAERYGLVKARARQGDKERKPEADKEAAPDDAKDATTSVDATDGAVEFAAEHGVDLASVKGSGKDGRIVKADVEAAVAGS